MKKHASHHRLSPPWKLSRPQQVFTLTRRDCGPPLWAVNMGGLGVGQASWCPDRALEALGDPMPVFALPDVKLALESVSRLNLPQWLIYSPREDPFAKSLGEGRRQAHVEVMRYLLERGHGLHLTTRGGIHESQALLRLARRFPRLLSLRIGLFALDKELESQWESGLAPWEERVQLGDALRSTSCHVGIEIGPIVPFANDDQKDLRALVRLAARLHLSEVALRWIEDGRGLEGQIEREISPSRARLVTGWFKQPGSQRGPHEARILPLQVRESRLESLDEALKKYGIHLASCRCSEHGARVACPSLGEHKLKAQLDLFSLEA